MTDYFTRHAQSLHYTKNMIERMRELSAPLFNHTMISNFSYLRFNQDGNVLNLTTEEPWIEFRFKEKIKYQILFKDHLTTAKHNAPYIYLWPNNTNTKDPLLGALHAHNIWNGCNIYFTTPNYIEVFSFASSVENANTQNFCINNLDLLKLFIISAKEQIFNLPGVKKKSNLILTELTLPASSPKDETVYASTIDRIYPHHKPKRIHISENIYLTPKELECCALLMRGKSIKSIAQLIELSPRTVETHLNKAKLRANCSSKESLLDYLYTNKWAIDSFLVEK